MISLWSWRHVFTARTSDERVGAQVTNGILGAGNDQERVNVLTDRLQNANVFQLGFQGCWRQLARQCTQGYGTPSHCIYSNRFGFV